jgi:ADP-ribose pyrophosphatase YjhB (NUDIX family)
MGNDFTYCPACGGTNISYVDHKKWQCPDCGFKLYNNVAASVALIITDGSGNVLFEKRAKEPRKGFLALPGGFCDQDESAEHAALRECMEETGMQPAAINYLCSFPNTYDYAGIRYKTCDLFFVASLEETFCGKDLLSQLHRQQSEVLSFCMKKISGIPDVEALPLAFESAGKALRFWTGKGGEK